MATNTNAESTSPKPSSIQTEFVACDPLVPFPPIAQLDIADLIHDPGQRQWVAPFTFVVVADPQFGLIEKYYMHRENPRWDVEIKVTTDAILAINKLTPKPKFVLVCGDMLDTRPGTDEEVALREEQYKDFMATISLLEDIKVVFCAGNHDVCDIPTPEAVSIYHRQFGPDFFSFWVNGVKFCVLNSSYWKSPATIPSEYKKQEQFMETLKDPEAKHLVIFQHIPFFVSHPDENDVGFLNIEKEQRFRVLDFFESIGVRYIFCGHYHRNSGGFYKGVEQIVTSALCNPLGNDPCGFRLVTVEQDKITSEFIPTGYGTTGAMPLSSKK